MFHGHAFFPRAKNRRTKGQRGQGKSVRGEKESEGGEKKTLANTHLIAGSGSQHTLTLNLAFREFTLVHVAIREGCDPPTLDRVIYPIS